MKKALYLLLFVVGLSNAQIVTIPDANFKQKLLTIQSVDLNGDGFLDIDADVNDDGEIQQSEADAVTGLFIANSNIFDLTGIQNFVNLEVLDCSFNHLSSIDVSGLANLEDLTTHNNVELVSLNTSNCVNLLSILLDDNFNLPTNLQTMNVSNCSSLTILYINGSQINNLNISGCFGLTDLTIFGGELTNLDVSGLSNIEHLECPNNNLSSIDVTGCTGLKYLLLYGNAITNLDLSEYQNLLEVHIAANNLINLNLTNCNNLNYLDIDNNPQLQTLNVQGCSNLPFILTLESQLSSLNLSGLTSLSEIYVNNANLSSINLNGCLNLEMADLHNNNLTSIDLTNLPALTDILVDSNLITELDASTNLNLTNIGVSNNPIVNLFAKNGANEGIFFNGSTSLAFICADETQVATIQSDLNTAGLTSTVVNSYCTFIPGGNYNTISGTVKLDTDNNGCDDSDISPSYLRMNISSNGTNSAVFTNTLGNYRRYVLTGDYTITPSIENQGWFAINPADAAVSFIDTNNNLAIQNFCVTLPSPHHDIEVEIAPSSTARPGFNATYLLFYRNKGNTTLSGQIVFNYEGSVLDYVSSSVNPIVQIDGNLTYDFADLSPLESRVITIVLNVNSPTDTPPVTIGDQLNFTAVVTPENDDEVPLDNAFSFKQIVVGAYDPNDITCLEGDVVPPSEIGEYLHYIVNFENTGNFYAENVVVKLDIDPAKFDISTLQLLNTSHPSFTQITNNRVEFMFEGINLEAVGGSKEDLNNGDSVSKRANIYFDYNAPIDTNIALTTFQTLSNSIAVFDESITVFPNPTNGNVNINSKFNIKSVELYDLQGRILETVLENSSSSTIDISERQKGIYFLKITTDEGSKVEKIMKE
jgi:Secretion system C-terminal sorting domain